MSFHPVVGLILDIMILTIEEAEKVMDKNEEEFLKYEKRILKNEPLLKNWYRKKKLEKHLKEISQKSARIEDHLK